MINIEQEMAGDSQQLSLGQACLAFWNAGSDQGDMHAALFELASLGAVASEVRGDEATAELTLRSCDALMRGGALMQEAPQDCKAALLRSVVRGLAANTVAMPVAERRQRLSDIRLRIAEQTAQDGGLAEEIAYVQAVTGCRSSVFEDDFCSALANLRFAADPEARDTNEARVLEERVDSLVGYIAIGLWVMRVKAAEQGEGTEAILPRPTMNEFAQALGEGEWGLSMLYVLCCAHALEDYDETGYLILKRRALQALAAQTADEEGSR